MTRTRIDAGSLRPGARRLGACLAGIALLSVVASLATACSTWSGFAKPRTGQLRERPEVRLGEASLKLHLVQPSNGVAPRALLFHVTGDSGWFGLDITYFDTMASRGYALAGVSARPIRARLSAAGAPGTTAQLAADYLALIDEARSRLRLSPDVPVVLTGLSRGASLAVVAAGEPELGRRIAGVLAMGLISRESSVRPPATPYSLLDRLACPLVVLESTVDRHVPASESRRLFGPDTATQARADRSPEPHLRRQPRRVLQAGGSGRRLDGSRAALRSRRARIRGRRCLPGRTSAS